MIAADRPAGGAGWHRPENSRSQSALALLSLCAALAFLAGAGHAEYFENAPFQAGSGGYHTYRIPAVAVTTNGTLLVFCEGRKNSSSDTGDIDLLLRRSTDSGKSWSAPQVVWDDGGHTCGNPCVVVDRQSGIIWLTSTWNLGNDSESEIINGTSDDTRRVFVLSSADDGLTWSAAQEITAAVKQSDWTWYATGPGSGIQIQHGPHQGRLVIPCDHIEAVSKKYFSHVIYSDDHGASWHLGGSTPQDKVNECEAVELSGGVLMLNMRNYDRSLTSRQTARSSDGGLSWAEQQHAAALIEPICQAAIERYCWPSAESAGIVLFSNPASTSTRTRMTLRRSYDDAATWDQGKLIYAGPSAYSDLERLPDGRIALLFEKGVSSAYESIAYLCFDLDYLDEPEPPDALPEQALWQLNEKTAGEPAELVSGAILDTHPAGCGLHMTPENAIAYTAGDPRYGGSAALAFTGMQRLRITDAATSNRLDFAAEDSFTLEAVVRVPAGSLQTGCIIGKDVASNQPSWWLRVESGRARFLLSDGPREPNLYSTVLINDGEWHHIAAVRDRAAALLRIYVDHIAAGTVADTTEASLANGNGVTIGMYNSGLRQFTGAIDFVRISNRALRPQAFVPVDHDGDGLPTDWELLYGLDPHDDGRVDPQQGAQGDPDRDGFSNSAEFLADSSPVDDTSGLRADLVIGAGRLANVGFRSSSNRWYMIERRDDLRSGAWMNCGSGVWGDGQRMEIPDPSSTSRGCGFYRIRGSLYEN